jgi:hypothetical protein
MMRRAGKPPEPTIRLISKSYCSAYCLEGQISVDLVLRRYPPTLRFPLLDKRTGVAPETRQV